MCNNHSSKYSKGSIELIGQATVVLETRDEAHMMDLGLPTLAVPAGVAPRCFNTHATTASRLFQS